MKHLIFDCGGVMVWPRLGEWNIPFGALEILGPRARDIYTSKYLTAHRTAVHFLDEDQLVPNVEAERHLRRKYVLSMNDLMDWQLTTLDNSRLADDFTDNINRYGLFEDVAPWLMRWKSRYSLGMLSDAMPSLIKFMDQWGLLSLFDATVISTQIGAIKPDPKMYEAILQKLNAEPADCLFVDDRAANLEGAIAAGMKAVQMARPAFLPEVLWDGPVVDSFEALDRLIEA
ncbi:MAG: HAD family hydrolase [Clostridia bacterium]|nr:HAD family hydrolase [Clostridia bacterium]